MSKFHEQASRPISVETEDLLWAAGIALRYPEIAEALRGRPGDGNGHPEIPPMQLTVFSKAGQLRFSLKAREGQVVWFGHVKRPEQLLESVEEALTAGDVEMITFSSNGAGGNRRNR